MYVHMDVTMNIHICIHITSVCIRLYIHIYTYLCMYINICPTTCRKPTLPTPIDRGTPSAVAPAWSTSVSFLNSASCGASCHDMEGLCLGETWRPNTFRRSKQPTVGPTHLLQATNSTAATWWVLANADDTSPAWPNIIMYCQRLLSFWNEVMQDIYKHWDM